MRLRMLLITLALLFGVPTFVSAVPAPAQAAPAVVEAKRSDCAKYHGLFRKYRLPVATFSRIAWRESGCNHRSFVIDHDDSGGGLLGINLKGRLAATWKRWCGATLRNITNAEVNIRCAAVAYRKMGLRPWGVRR